MNGSRRVRSQRCSFFFFALLAFYLSGAPVHANELIPVYVDEYGITVRSEPGEDPHLRVKIFIQNSEDCSTVTLSESRDEPSLFVPLGDGGLYEESRMLCGLRILLRMMVYTLPR